ncbi:MAG: ornithine cyclodeaminase family protein [Candidatus Heimdallarchaeota archaeon]|nr:ornithine cyclodeaminase family protein [Candidatus Heimdallarchaeota archaeon]
MSLLIVSPDEVKSALTMEKCIELMIEAHGRLQKDQAHQPLRTAMIPPQAKGILACMPAYLSGNEEVMGLKVVTVFHDNHKLGLDSHQGVILLLDPASGVIQAVIDGREITAIRTAAASGAATKYLARENAQHLALIGAGVQAHTHLEAISKVRDIKSVTIWNRTRETAEAFATKYQSSYEILVVDNISEAIKNADIICTVTASDLPLIDLSMVKPGTHINAVGTATPNARELATDLIVAGSLFTDVYESAMNEAGEIVIPISEGALDPNPKIVELGDLVNNIYPGRVGEEEITIYKSLGVGIQDLAAANYVYEWAKINSKGARVQF